MLNFKGVVTLLGVKETPWTNPDTNQTFNIIDVVCYSNTGFKTGPQAYVYHLKLNKDTKALLPQIKAWDKGTQVSVAGLVTSVDTPMKSDPTRNWTKVGLLTSEIAPAMQTVAAPDTTAYQQEPSVPVGNPVQQPVSNYQQPPQELQPVTGQDFDSIPF